METLIIQIDTAQHAKEVASLLKKIKGVKSVTKETKKYNWTDPSRPATDEEILKMIASGEDSPLLTVKEAKASSYARVSKWKTKKK